LMSANSKRSGIDSENLANVLPSSGPDAILSRKVTLAPPKDKDSQGAVIAVPDNKLKPGEVAMFEIRLRHIQTKRESKNAENNVAGKNNRPASLFCRIAYV